MRKPSTVPCLPQPKQWKNCLSGLTQKDGVFSLWNGQQALYSRPDFFSCTRAPMISTMSARAMSSSMKCWGMRPKCRAPSGRSAEFLLDPCADRTHVGAALGLRLHEAHDLTHVLDGSCTGGADRLGNQRIELGVTHLR